MLNLNFREPLDGAVTLNADEQAVVSKAIRDIEMAARFLRESVKTGTAQKDPLYSALSVIESQLACLCKKTGIEIDSASEREARYAEIRKANLRIRELEQQRGAQVDPQAIGLGLKHLSDRLDSWWDEHGFCYIHDVSFSKWGGLEATLALNPRARMHSFSETPVTDRLTYDQWLDNLQAQGYSINREDGRGDESLEDTPRARELLLALISEHLPSARISAVNTTMARKSQTFLLRDIKLYVHDLRDIARLRVTEAPMHEKDASDERSALRARSPKG